MPQNRVYLDYNASAPLLPDARAVMLAALENDANPSSVHQDGRAARRTIEHARRQVAALVGGTAEHVVFTSGATEAANLLLTPRWQMGRAPLRMSRLYVAASDHPCLLGGGAFDSEAMIVLPVKSSGLIDLAALEDALGRHDRTEGLALVAIHAANNETGVVQPLAEISSLVKAAGGVLVVDAVQAAGRIHLDMSGAYGDFLVLSSHKIGGPKGAGAVVARSNLMMPRPLLRGGGQEKGHRAGTENVAAVAGFGAAAELARGTLADMERQSALRDAARDRVSTLFPDAIIHGADAPRLANTLYFSIPGVKAETLQIALDLAGISVSSGSACSSGKVGPSHVLAAMGVPGDEGAIRLSLGLATTEADIEAFATALAGFAQRRRQQAA